MQSYSRSQFQNSQLLIANFSIRMNTNYCTNDNNKKKKKQKKKQKKQEKIFDPKWSRRRRSRSGETV